jgi:hypothetical protein
MALKLLSLPENTAKGRAAVPARGKPRLVLVEGPADLGKEVKEEPKKPKNKGLPPSLLDYALNIKNPVRSYSEAWKLVEEHIGEIPSWAKYAGLMKADVENPSDVISEAICSCFITALRYDASLGGSYATLAKADIKRAFPFAGRIRRPFRFTGGELKWASRYRKSRLGNRRNADEAFMREWDVSARFTEILKNKIPLMRNAQKVADGHDAFNGTHQEDTSAFRKERIPHSSPRSWENCMDLHPLMERLHDSRRISRGVQGIMDKVLTPIEKKVVLLRMGPMGKEGDSLKEIGNMPIWKRGEVSAERVRQVEERALMKLKRGITSEKLRKLFHELPD